MGEVNQVFLVGKNRICAQDGRFFYRQNTKIAAFWFLLLILLQTTLPGQTEISPKCEGRTAISF
jgi:hypothetical protein